MLELDLLSIMYHRNRRHFVLSRFRYQWAHQIIKNHGWEFAGAYPDEEAQIYDDTNKQTWSHISASSGRSSALLSRREALSNIVTSSSADLFDTYFGRSWNRWKRECQSDFLTLEDNTKAARIDRIISSTNRNWELIPAHAEDKRQCQYTFISKQWMHLLRSSIFPWRRYWYRGEKYCIDFDVRTHRRLELPWLENAIFVQSQDIASGHHHTWIHVLFPQQLKENDLPHWFFEELPQHGEWLMGRRNQQPRMQKS